MNKEAFKKLEQEINNAIAIVCKEYVYSDFHIFKNEPKIRLYDDEGNDLKIIIESVEIVNGHFLINKEIDLKILTYKFVK